MHTIEHDAYITGAAMLLRRRSRKVLVLRGLLEDARRGTDALLLSDLLTRLHEAEREELEAELQLEGAESDG